MILLLIATIIAVATEVAAIFYIAKLIRKAEGDNG